MDFLKSSKIKLLNLKEENFHSFALEVFRFQAKHNQIYKAYIEHLNVRPSQIHTIEEIPFLPIEFFKSHPIVSTHFKPVKVFESSGTTGTRTSRHYIEDLIFYQKVSKQIFEFFYGPLTDYHVLALLPSYLERNNSSLVFMVDSFIQISGSPYSGFFLQDFKKLAQMLEKSQNDSSKKTLLIGVTFALLELAEKYPMNLSSLTIMETGGMKGRRKEMLRAEVHQVLQKSFNLPKIHSEYGMTELLSQSYSKGNEVFYLPPWMKILLRETNDPLYINTQLESGVINIIDLANLHSCAFIATQDLGIKMSNGGFKVSGRIDHSDIRGCNLLYL